MEVIGENTMAKFRNQLSQPLILDGEWQVALSLISFPSNINNLNSNGLVLYKTREWNSTPQIIAVDTSEKFAKAFTVAWIN